MAGVIFVGVDALPAPDGVSTTYEVRLGLSRRYERDTGQALIKNILEEEIESGEFNIHVAVYCGSPGTCHEGDAGPGSPPS